MIQATIKMDDENKKWKAAFIVISILILIIMPLLSRNYGQSGDEWLQIEYGQDIWNYFFKGNLQALDYSNQTLQHSHQELYGGLFDFPLTVLHYWLPSVPVYILRHFFNAIFGAVLMIFTGLIAWRISKKWSIGVLALLFILFSPRIFGESMNNPKDIPFACGFTIGLYYLLTLLQDYPSKRWKYAIGMGIGFAIAYGVRSAGGILLAAYFILLTGLCYFLDKDFKATLRANNNKLLKQLVLALIVAIGLGYIIGMSCWPWGLQSPISHPIEALKGMTNREIELPVLFDGQYYTSTQMPALYEFKWICISTPVIVLLGLLLFIIMVLGARKRYSLFGVIFLLFGAFFPLVYMIYKGSTVYDTWRHVFFVYPYWAIMGALGFDMADRFTGHAKYKLLPLGIAILGLLPAIVWTFKSNPNQYVYFNELVGGVRGAAGNYDLDYYFNTSLQGAKWIEENVKPLPGKKIEVRSNMTGLNNYFAKDSNWIESDYMSASKMATRQDWDYYVLNPRYLPEETLADDSWAQMPGVVHIITVDDVPLCAIIRRN